MLGNLSTKFAITLLLLSMSLKSLHQTECFRGQTIEKCHLNFTRPTLVAMVTKFK